MQRIRQCPTQRRGGGRLCTFGAFAVEAGCSGHTRAKADHGGGTNAQAQPSVRVRENGSSFCHTSTVTS